MKVDRVYLDHVRESIDYILEFTREGRDAFYADVKTQLAVIRCVEVIGEAVKNLSGTFRDAHPGVPWKAIAGMRDRLIHGYFNIKLDVVWETVERDIPALKPQIEAMLAELPAGPAPSPSPESP